MRAERGNPVGVRPWQQDRSADRKEGPAPQRAQDDQEANAGGRKAAGNRDIMADSSGGRPGQLAGYGHMPGPERVLTWSGEPRGRRREASEPEDTLDAASAVNRPRAVPIGG